MALHIKNKEVDQLVTEIAKITGVSKTDAVRQAVQEMITKLEDVNRKVPGKETEAQTE